MVSKDFALGGSSGSSGLGHGSVPSDFSQRMKADLATGVALADYWRLALKHRFVIIGAFIGAVVLGIVVTLLTTPTYTASTTLQIDREAARVLNVDDVQPRQSESQSEEFYQTQYGLLRSRSLAESVIDSLGLASSDTFLEQMDVTLPRNGGTAAERSSKRREAVLKAINDNLGVAPIRGSRLVIVSFDSPDPALSARVANAFAENFIQSNLDRKYESSSYAREFLEDLIAQTKARLEDSERQLVAYATNQQIINVREASDQTGPAQSLAASNLAALNSELAEAKASRIAAEQRWNQARATPVMSIPEVLGNPAIQRLAEEKARVEAEYRQKSAVYQPEWPEMLQLRNRTEELSAEINAIAAGIRTSIQGQYLVAANEEAALQRQVSGLKGEVLDLADRSIQYNILQREVDTSRTLYDGLLQRYKEVGVTGGVTTNNISVVDQAEAPPKPSSPKLLVNLAIAALLGLGVGVLAAFILEALDETLATPDDVENKLSVPAFGAVPQLSKGETPLSALSDVRSPFSEAYYSIRTALQFSTPNGAPRSILITSSRPAEGKSTTAFALAQGLAKIGKRALLVDGDLRNPSMHRLMGIDNEQGMSNLLSGSAGLRDLVHDTSTPNLSFIPCGPLPPNPAELWASERIQRFIEEASEIFDHIVIDGPPVLGFADAPILASNVEGTLFVLESRGTKRGQARGALARLRMGSANILGAVLTKFNAKAASLGGYNYAYDYHYGGANASQGRKH